MKPIYATLVAGVVALAMMLSACHSASDSADADIASAEEAMAYERTDEALAIAEALLNSGDSLTASQYGRLSMIYMRAAESVDAETNTTQAYQCYTAAYSVDADSAAAWYSNVSADDQRFLQMLSQLKNLMDDPDRNIIDEYCSGDSTLVEP